MVVVSHGVRLDLGLLVAAALRYHGWTVAPTAALGVPVLSMALVLPYYEVEVSIVEALVCDAPESVRCFLNGLASPPTALLSDREAHAFVSLNETLFRQPDRVFIRDHSVADRHGGLLQENCGSSVPHGGFLGCGQVRAGLATRQLL